MGHLKADNKKRYYLRVKQFKYWVIQPSENVYSYSLVRMTLTRGTAVKLVMLIYLKRNLSYSKGYGIKPKSSVRAVSSLKC